MKQFYGAVSVTALMSTAVLVQPAVAQDEEMTLGLEEIVISAQRREESIQDVPIAVTAFTPQDLSNRQIFDTKDLVQFIPNAFVDNNTGLGSANTVFIRGLGNTESIATFDPPVGTYVDDVFIARQNANNFALFDVERIEVLRGPQGTLFGRNTTGGAVSVVLAKPAEEMGGYFEIGYGRFDRIMARGSIDIPITDTLFTKFSAYHIDDQGYVNNTVTGERLNDQNAFGVRAAVAYHPNDDFEWNISWDYSEDRFMNLLNSVDANGDRVSGTGFSRDGAALAGLLTGFKTTLPLGNEIEASNITSKISYTINSDHAVEVITGIRDLNQNFAIDFFNFPAPYGGFTIANQGQHNQFTQEVKFNGSFAEGKLDYVAGAFYFDERNNTDLGDILGFLAPFPIVAADRLIENDTTSFAAFAQFDYHVTEKLTLTAGIRWTDEEKTIAYRDNRGGGLNTQGILDAGIPTELNASEWTPRFALQYEQSDDVMLFLSATRGFKSGGWNARGTAANEILPFDIETVWSYEAGMRSDWLDNRLRLNVTAFYMDVDDFQTPSAFTRPNGSLAFLTRNFADLENYGIEAELTAVISENLTVFANIGLQNASQTPDQSAPDVDEFGFQSVAAQQRDCLAGVASACGSGIVLADGSIADPTRTPDFTLTAGFNYERDISALKGSLGLNASVNYATSTCISTDCDRDLSFDVTYADSRALVNAGLVYRHGSDAWEAAIECQNCFDEVYNTAVLVFPYLNEPARWMLRLTTRFGG